jgi:hypothetical protein
VSVAINSIVKVQVTTPEALHYQFLKHQPRQRKFVTKIISNAVTTAAVVDCPTPWLPVVVKPQLHPITAIKAPKQIALIMALQISQTWSKFRAESINTVEEMLYKLVEISHPQPCL